MRCARAGWRSLHRTDNWLVEAATAKGLVLEKNVARAEIYGMSYEAWKALHQREASPEQLAKFSPSARQE